MPERDIVIKRTVKLFSTGASSLINAEGGEVELTFSKDSELVELVVTVSRPWDEDAENNYRVTCNVKNLAKYIIDIQMMLPDLNHYWPLKENGECIKIYDVDKRVGEEMFLSNLEVQLEIEFTQDGVFYRQKCDDSSIYKTDDLFVNEDHPVVRLFEGIDDI